MADRWILQFCHGYSGPFLDVARQYASLFQDSAYKVLTVYLTGKPSSEAREQSASNEVVFLNYDSRDVRGLKISAIRAFKRIVAGRDIALIIAHRFKPIYIACLATKLPVIGVHHAFGDYERPQRRWFAQLFSKRLALLAVSDAVRDTIRIRLPDWPHDRIETLHNRLDLDFVRAGIKPREEARRILGLPQEATVVANVGRLHPDKDQTTLLAGFSLALPNLPTGTLLVIAGSGPLEGKLRGYVTELGIGEHVRLLGQIPNARGLFSAFDLFVLSSDHEPFGMVLLEAMAADVPVMATDCGGAPEVIGRNNLLFGLKAPEQLASKLTDFFTEANVPYRREMAIFGKHRLQDYFSDEVARKRFFSLPMVQAALATISDR